MKLALVAVLSVNTIVAVVNVGIDGGTFGKTERWMRRKNQETRDSLIEKKIGFLMYMKKAQLRDI